ncbi:hypothetical protein GOBAR_AA09261 [Gossypium barbadense]|uniref:Uncharacterized protein n=1 Tax=Gossypium barbadense TaxID=3634 RepID=A0A2P5Y6Y8_GOSBA|nr:hypothetical protein GOBAR_AA09261 [Gossypium barbadense]
MSFTVNYSPLFLTIFPNKKPPPFHFSCNPKTLAFKSHSFQPLLASRRIPNYPQVGFSVDGVLILAFLWVLKAFLEVVCTLGSAVFVTILLIRGIWTGVTFMQESRDHRRINEPFDDPRSWNGAQPAT